MIYTAFRLLSAVPIPRQCQSVCDDGEHKGGCV